MNRAAAKTARLNLITEKLHRNRVKAMQRTRKWSKDSKRKTERKEKKISSATTKILKISQIQPQKIITSSNQTEDDGTSEAYLVEFPDASSECTLDEMLSLDSMILHSVFDEDSVVERTGIWSSGRKSSDCVEERDHLGALSDSRVCENLLTARQRNRRRFPMVSAPKCAFCRNVIGDVAFMNGTKNLCYECAEQHFENVTKSRLQEQPISYKEFKAVGGDTIYSVG